MSLEAVIEKNTLAVEAMHAALLEVIGLTKTGKTSGTAAAGNSDEEGTKEKKTRAKKGETDADKGSSSSEGTAGAPDLDKLKKALGAWLGEFAKAEDKDNPDGAHPEVIARKEALRKAFAGLKVASLKEVTTPEQIAKLAAWHEKAKGVDKGFGAGRFVADPVETDEDEGGEDDELEV